MHTSWKIGKRVSPGMVIRVIDVLLQAFCQGSFGRGQGLHRMTSRTDVWPSLGECYDAYDDANDRHEEEDEKKSRGHSIPILKDRS